MGTHPACFFAWFLARCRPEDVVFGCRIKGKVAVPAGFFLDWPRCGHKNEWKGYTWYTTPRHSKTFQDIPRHSKTFQDVPRHSKTFQDVPRHSKTFQDYPECLTWVFPEGSLWLFPNIAMVFHREITSSNSDAEAWFVVEQPSYGTCTDRWDGGIWIWTSWRCPSSTDQSFETIHRWLSSWISCFMHSLCCTWIIMNQILTTAYRVSQ